MGAGTGRLLWLAVPLVAGAGAWFALRGGGGQEAEHADGRRAVGESAAAEALEAGAAPALAAARRGSLSIHGRVLLTSGRPAPGARVTASLKPGQPLAVATAGKDGAYELVGLAKDIYSLGGEWTEGELVYGAEAAVSTSVEVFDLVLSELPRSLLVRVRDAAGEPVARFDVRLVTRRGVRMLGTRGGGEARVQVGAGLFSDSVRDYRGAFVEVWNARDLEDRGLGLAPRRVGPLGGTEKEVEVTLVAGPMCEGVVLGPAPTLEPPVTLVMEIPKTESSDGPDFEELLQSMLPGAEKKEGGPDATSLPPFAGLVSRVKTAPDGRFRIAFVHDAAEHVLAVQPGTEYLPVPTVAVRPGDAPLEIRLRAAVWARVTVVDPEGKPVADASVSTSRVISMAEREEAGEFRTDRMPDWGRWSAPDGETGADGVAHLEGLDPEAKYTLTVHPPTPKEPMLASRWRRFTIHEWSPADLLVRLEPGLHVRGRVLDAEGRPAASANVVMRGEQNWDSTTADEQGRFTFDGLAPGEHMLRASPGGAARQASAWDFEYEVEDDADPKPREGGAQLSLDLETSLDDVVLRVPSTLSVTLRLPFERPPAADKPKFTDLFGSMFSSGTSVHVLRKDERGWVKVEHVYMTPDLSGGPRAAEQILQGKDAVGLVHGLEAGETYALWCPPKDGKYVYQPLDPKAGSVTLERRVGGTVSGKVLGLPEGVEGAQVDLEDDLGRDVGAVKTARDGTFEVKGLPPGTWQVRAHCKTGSAHFESTGSARTDSVLDLRLEQISEEEWNKRNACGSGGKACG